MEIRNIFYSAGIIFFMVLVGYFVGTYLDMVSSQVKAVLTFMLAVLLFLIGDLLRRNNL